MTRAAATRTTGTTRSLGGGGELDCIVVGGDGVCDGESGFVRMCLGVWDGVKWWWTCRGSEDVFGCSKGRGGTVGLTYGMIG